MRNFLASRDSRPQSFHCCFNFMRLVASMFPGNLPKCLNFKNYQSRKGLVITKLSRTLRLFCLAPIFCYTEQRFKTFQKQLKRDSHKIEATIRYLRGSLDATKFSVKVKNVLQLFPSLSQMFTFKINRISVKRGRAD